MKVPLSVLRALRQAAADHGVPLDLLAAIHYHESGFNRYAVGDLDAGVSLGSGQLNLKGAGAGYRSRPYLLFDPTTNCQESAAYLAELLRLFGGDTERAISGYNQGATGASAPDWRTVNYENYVRPVLATLEAIRREGLEEDWDPDVPDAFRPYGKTMWDVAVTLKGVADDALAAGRRMREQAQKIAEEWGAR